MPTPRRLVALRPQRYQIIYFHSVMDIVLASGSYDGHIRFWKVVEQKCYATIDFETAVCSLSVSPNKQFIAAAGFNSLKIYRVDNQQLQASFKPNSDCCFSQCMFSKTGEYIFGVTEDYCLKVYDTRQLQSIFTYRNKSIVNCVEEVIISDRGLHLVIIGDQQGQILVFDVRHLSRGPLEVVRAFDRDTGVRSLSIAQNMLACCDSRGIVQIYDIAVDSIPNPGTEHGYVGSHDSPITGVSSELQGSSELSGTLLGTDQRYRSSKPQANTCGILRLRLSIQAHPEQIHKVRISPNGSHVATAGMDHVIKLWSLQNDSLVKLSQIVVESCCMDLAFSSAGQLLLVGCDKFPRLFNVQNNKLEQIKQYGGHAKSVTAVCFGD